MSSDATNKDAVCHALDYWAQAPWPLDKDQVIALAPAVGWSLNAHGDLITGKAVNEPQVHVSAPNRQVNTITFYASDRILDASEEEYRRLNDRFVELVRAGTRLWGRPSISRGSRQKAAWDLGERGRIRFSFGGVVVWVEYTTPQYSEVLRTLGQ